MPQHIAIVEDEAAIADNYRDALQRRGFSVSIYTNRRSASDAFLQRLPDLAIIDIGLGDEVDGGFDLCRDLRSRCPVLPIVILTARDSELDEISGLRLGANDYLSKDINQDIMLARISTLLRLVQALREPEQEADILTQDNLSLNPERKKATWHTQVVDLTVPEFDLVLCLAKRPGHVKSRQQLMHAAGKVVEEHSINSHIKRIRRKFEVLDPEFDAVETVYGAGYRWNEQ